MPKLKSVQVTYGRKFNLGNYESAELSATVWAEYEPDDEEHGIGETNALLFDHAKSAVKEQYIQIVEAIKRKQLAQAKPEVETDEADAETETESDD